MIGVSRAERLVEELLSSRASLESKWSAGDGKVGIVAHQTLIVLVPKDTRYFVIAFLAGLGSPLLYLGSTLSSETYRFYRVPDSDCLYLIWLSCATKAMWCRLPWCRHNQGQTSWTM